MKSSNFFCILCVIFVLPVSCFAAENIQPKTTNQAETELNENIVNVKNKLIGTWRTENYLVTYKSDGSYIVKQDSGDGIIGTWIVAKDKLKLDSKKIKNTTSKGEWVPFKYVEIYKIISIDENECIYKLGEKISTAKRI